MTYITLVNSITILVDDTPSETSSAIDANSGEVVLEWDE